MLRHGSSKVLVGIAAGTLLVYLAGCTSSPTDSEQPAAKSSEKKTDDHAHKPGSHGGIIVEIGRDSYHAEVVFDKAGDLKLYTLGKDETRVIDVENQTLTAYVKLANATEAHEVVLKPVAQPGDPKERTSQFVGKLPTALMGQSLVVTIPNIAINGERFRLGFTSATPEHSQDMTSHLGADEEKDLYQKPGGLYTDADIRANGTRSAAEKFKGIRAQHDDQPRVGDKICPITSTKANPRFTWVVNGQSYEFCCPPCVDEFVQNAKQRPELIKPPTDYVLRGK
jgi:hypothetical protein